MHPDISLHPIKTINIKVYIHVQIIQTFRQGGWGVHPNSEIRGGAVSKNIFSAFQASVWSKHKGSPPLDPPLICMARRSECGNQQLNIKGHRGNSLKKGKMLLKDGVAMLGFALPACYSECFLLSCMHGLKVATLKCCNAI